MEVKDIKAHEIPEGLRQDNVTFHGEDGSTITRYFDDRRNIVYQKHTKNGMSRWTKVSY